MTKHEFLTAKYIEGRDKYRKNHYEFYSNPSTARCEPFKIADNLYYVGDKKVCVHLIDTGDGLIVLDSGYFEAAHLLVDSIWRAGFDPANVRWIIHTHGHHDHFGASEEFRRMYGTKLAISRADAESLREYPHRAGVDSEVLPYAKIPEFDYEIEDGEIFELGNVKIRCVLTPGHTEGVLSLFFDVTDNGKTCLAGMFGGAGISALRLSSVCYNQRSENCAQQMLDSIDKVWDEPVVVHIGNHPYNSWTFEKRAKQLSEGGNPFVAPDSWQKFLGELKGRINDIIKENEEMKKELDKLED